MTPPTAAIDVMSPPKVATDVMTLLTAATNVMTSQAARTDVMPSQSFSPNSVAPTKSAAEMVELPTSKPKPQVRLDVISSDVVVTISSSLLTDA